MRKKVIVLIRNAQSYDFGGAERFPVFVSNVLKVNGLNPVIITRSPGLSSFAKDSNITVIKGLWWSKQNWNGINLLLLPIYILWQVVLFFWYLIKFIKIRPKAVHIQSKDDFIAATYAARLCRSRVIWTDHADIKHIWLNLRVWHKNPIGKLVYISAMLAHTITVISKSEYREVTKHLPKKSPVWKKIQIINNGTPDKLERYTSHKSKMFTFVSTNRLVDDKGLREMIEAFRIFHGKHPKSQLILVGNGPEEEKYKLLAKDIPKIRFEGYQADPLKYVADADILLQPTYHEGFSISILEAFMMKKPVIATSVGGNPEMIKDGYNGILVPPKDPVSLFEAMDKMYTRPKLRSLFVDRSRKLYVDNFIFDDIVKDKYIPLYEGVLS